MSTVLITGCGSGFGRGLALAFLDRGDHVVATDPELTSLRDLRSERCLTLSLDLRDDRAVARAVQHALAWRPVDVLVNNGGFAVFGTQEELPLELVRDMFDVNVFGAARMTRALLPTLRERAGTIVQLSSVAGRCVFPESGWYAATKHAIEAMSDALVQECASFGVRVRVVQPGSFDTRFLETAQARSPRRDPASPYASERPLWDRRKLSVLEPPQDPAEVVRAIVASVQEDTPFERVVAGADAKRLIALRDGIGADPWSRLQARRNGLLVDSAPAGDVLTPRQVLDGADPAGPTELAWRLGHLDHWEDTEEGRAALDRLAGR